METIYMDATPPQSKLLILTEISTNTDMKPTPSQKTIKFQLMWV